jgi:hypothetical protein
MNRRILVPLVVLALGAGAGVAARSRSTAGGETAPTVVAWRPADVARLLVASGDRRVELIRGGQGTWRALSDTSPQTANLLVSFEDRLLPMRAYRAVTADPTDDGFALNEPEIVLDLEAITGERQRVALGAPTFTGGGFYVRHLGASRRIYLVPRRTIDDLRSLIKGQLVTSADPFSDKVRQREAEELDARRRKGMTPYLQQVLDAGADLPPELR